MLCRCIEGIKFADGTYVANGEAKNDGFGHAVLGGAEMLLHYDLRIKYC